MNIDVINEIKINSNGNFVSFCSNLLEYGVVRFTTCAQTGKSIYFNYDNECVYDEEDYFFNEIGILDIEGFKDNLFKHQNGELDFLTWVCATANCGVVSWTVDLNEGTCSYLDEFENIVYIEQF